MVRGCDGGEPGGGRAEYRFVYVDQKGFEAHPAKHFTGLVEMFRDYQSWRVEAVCYNNASNLLPNWRNFS